jgi:hypothetical protein
MADLTSHEMEELQVDAALGRKSKINTPEAVEFRKNHERFIKEVKAKGGTVHINSDHPDLSNN